jgi:hypothetical protein
MARRHRPLSKAELVHRLVPGLRPKLADDQVRDLSLVHHVNLHSLRDGTADAALMWQWFGGVLTWSKVAEIRGIGVDEMRDQAALCLRVADRYRETGHITLADNEYELAVAGVIVMDELARRVDRATAIVAAEWSETQINLIATAEAAGDTHATA